MEAQPDVGHSIVQEQVLDAKSDNSPERAPMSDWIATTCRTSSSCSLQATAMALQFLSVNGSSCSVVALIDISWPLRTEFVVSWRSISRDCMIDDCGYSVERAPDRAVDPPDFSRPSRTALT